MHRASRQPRAGLLVRVILLLGPMLAGVHGAYPIIKASRATQGGGGGGEWGGMAAEGVHVWGASPHGRLSGARGRNGHWGGGQKGAAGACPGRWQSTAQGQADCAV